MNNTVLLLGVMLTLGAAGCKKDKENHIDDGPSCDVMSSRLVEERLMNDDTLRSTFNYSYDGLNRLSETFTTYPPNPDTNQRGLKNFGWFHDGNNLIPFRGVFNFLEDLGDTHCRFSYINDLTITYKIGPVDAVCYFDQDGRQIQTIEYIGSDTSTTAIFYYFFDDENHLIHSSVYLEALGDKNKDDSLNYTWESGNLVRIDRPGDANAYITCEYVPNTDGLSIPGLPGQVSRWNSLPSSKAAVSKNLVSRIVSHYGGGSSTTTYEYKLDKDGRPAYRKETNSFSNNSAPIINMLCYKYQCI